MSRARAVVWLLLAVAAAALVAHSLVFNFVTDDAFISFVYARNLARHGQLVFNLGERVEGYTNFLWTVILAALMKVGLAPEATSRVLGTACAIVTGGVCAFLSRDAASNKEWSAWDALPALVLAGVPGWACWSSGGLETQLFAMCVTLGAAWYLADDQPRPRSAIAFALAALTRPEGNLFFALTALHRGLSNLARRRVAPSAAELRWVGVFLAGVVPHFLWRRWYYGWWLPNTFYIKASGGAGTWTQGVYYLRRFVEDFHLWALPLVVVAGVWWAPPRARRLVGYATLLVAVFFAYVISVGGDFMGLYRFALPVLPIAVVAAAVCLRALLGARPLALQLAAVVALLGAHAWHAVRVDRHAISYIGADRGIDTPGYLRWYTADRAAIGRWFGRYARPDDYAAVGGAGAQVYYSGIASLDCFGLSDAHIAHDVAPVSNRPGHQKYAPLDYQLARRPTIITSNYYRIEPAPYRPSPYDEADWRRRGYRYVSVEVPGLSSPWYTFLLRNDRTLGPIGPVDAERDP